MAPGTHYLIDTNLLLYLHDPGEEIKQSIARDVIERCGRNQDSVLSTQVLSEFCSSALRKENVKVGGDQIVSVVRSLTRSFPVIPITFPVVEEALRGALTYRLSYYDAQIWATAKLNQIPTILTEDLQSAKTLEGVTFIDPFTEEID